VADIPGLLHGLTQVLTGEIMTTPLEVRIPDTFSPYTGLSVSTNFPVTPEILSQAVELTDGNTNASGTISRIAIVVAPEKNEDGSSSETHFTITPKDHPFMYSTDYSLVVHTTLHPKYGTESLGQEVQKSIHTSAYATVAAFQNVKDSSGTLSDTRSYSMST
jgi:hypothetical protein